MYVIYKRYERPKKGQLPDVITKYLTELPPIVELDRDIEKAMTFNEDEAKELAYLVAMDYREMR